MDKEARKISTKFPTVSRMGHGTSWTIIQFCPNHQIYARNITQAYTQSEAGLERIVYFEGVPELGLHPYKVLIAVKLLYVIPEAGLHWFLTYCRFHENTLV